ncbi:hypothetical protein C100_18930 [Sphingobium sp. C100]|jgi:hypothetical protein|uniref:hypothetical protein n=1 Tax=Sphingobium sp. C100 TaxID=1207055 RepID=UPI0003D65735|nr:hypothetical protein [Sphingobium sp. C100]ETI60435.1 hypothetical protein C100_18930 [Sphingobium sp. C100]
MTILATFRRSLPLIVQCGLVLFGLTALYAMPPANGQMLLVPITADSRSVLASVAITHGARLVSAGPWAGSLLVEGRRDQLLRPLIRQGVIAISARAGGCGEPS